MRARFGSVCQADLGWTFDASERVAIDIATVRQNFGLWKAPSLVISSVQVMLLLLRPGHPFLVNFLLAKISLTGLLGWAEEFPRLEPTSST